MKAVALVVMTAMAVFSLSCACPEKCTCTPHNVICKDSTIKSLPRWRPSTLRLFMEGDVLFQLNSSVVNASELTNLEALTLLYMNLQGIHSRAFGGMRHLEMITIRNNNLTDLQPGAFIGLDRLHTLDLSDNELKNISSGVFEGLTALRHLNLTINRLRHFHNGMFDGLRREGRCGEVPNARSVLLLDRNYNGTFDEDSLRGLNYFTNLAMSFEFIPSVSHPTTFEGLCGLKTLLISDTQMFSGVVNKTTMRGLVNLLYLEITYSPLRVVASNFLADSKSLRKLSIVYSFVKLLEPGCFHGLESLSELVLNGNQLTNLSKNVFDGLTSLKSLSVKFNYLTAIEENALLGLHNLRFLILSNNGLRKLEMNTFSGLVSLRELLINNESPESQVIPTNMGPIYLTSKNKLRYTHPETFAGLSQLKRLELSYFPNDEYSQVNISSLQRLDGFMGPGYFESESLEAMTTLFLIGWYSLVPNEMRTWLSHLTHIKNPIRLEIYYLNSLDDLRTLSEFNIHTLNLIVNNISIFRNNDFREFSTLKSLGIGNTLDLVVQNGSFRNLHNLEYLNLYSSKKLFLEPGVFNELHSLQELVIKKNPLSEFDLVPHLFQGLRTVKTLTMTSNNIINIDFDSFVDLLNLETLDLSNNKIAELKQGVFRELHNILTLNLRNNLLSSIDAGVFGALCPDNFTLTCSNLTRLSQFCNTSFALHTLADLDLSYNNNISFIHQQAFLGCNQLEFLILSYTKIQVLDFLYVPRLQGLWYQVGNLSIISNNTFECTPRLSQIYFQYTELGEIHPSAFENLRDLKTVHLPKVKCDCTLRALWKWLRSRRVEYKLCNDYHCLSCNGELIDTHLSKLECNSSGDRYNLPRNKTSASSDYAQFKTYIEPIVFIFIFLSGCFGNGLLVFLVLSHSDLRNKNNACIVHLAVADILSLVLNLPLSYWDVVHISWDLEETACKIFIMSKDLVVSLVVFTVLALTFERFLVVRSSFKLKSACGFNSRPAVFLGLVWIQSLIGSMPSYFNATVRGRCFSSPPGRDDAVQRTWTFQLLMYCIVPVTSIVFLNIVTAYVLKESIQKIPGEVRNESREKKRKTVANLVLILSVVFTLSYLPSFLLRALVSWSVVDIQEVFWYSFATYCLFFFHTIFNPFALFVMSSKYKMYIMKYIRRWIKEKEQEKPFLPAGGDTEHEQRGPADEGAQDEAARQARLERLKKLQARFM